MKYIVLEHHPNDSRIRISDDGICQSLTSRMGTEGGNVPLVLAFVKSTDVIVFQQNQREELRIMNKPGAITSESGMHNQNFVVIKR